MPRHILFLHLVLLFSAVPGSGQSAGPVSFTNLEARYVDLRMQPMLANNGNVPIYVRTTDESMLVKLMYFDKAKRVWGLWPALGYCGNVEVGVKVIAPGEKASVAIDWGIQAEYFDVEPPPKTEFKITISYSLETPISGQQTQQYTVESKPFRLEFSKHKKTS